MSRISNTATSFVVAFCFVAGIPAIIVGGRSSSKRGERIWHVALPWLLTSLCLAAASLTRSNAIVLAALVIGLAANYATYGAFFSLPPSILRGTAAAGGIGFVGTFGNFGAFLGPILVCILVQGSGDFRTGFAAIAIGYALAALIVIGVGDALALLPDGPTQATWLKSDPKTGADHVQYQKASTLDLTAEIKATLAIDIRS